MTVLRMMIIAALALGAGCTELKSGEDRTDGATDADIDTGEDAGVDADDDADPDADSDADPDGETGCTDNSECPEEQPICSADGSCQPCQSNAECRAPGEYFQTCDLGECVTFVDRIDRCTVTEPEDLFDRLGTFHFVAGNLMDRTVTTHQAREKSARLAFQQASAAGGLTNGDVGQIYCTIEENPDFDDLSRQDAAVFVARWLANVVGVHAIVGPAGSGDTGAVFSALKEDGEDVVIVSPSATSPTLTLIDEINPSAAQPGRLWRTAPPDSFQGRQLAIDVAEGGIESVVIVATNGAYGEGLAEEFENAFTARGGTIVDSFFYDADNTERRDERIAEAGALTADAVVFISLLDNAIAFAAAAATNSDFDDKQLLFGDGAGTSEFVTALPSSLLGRVRGTRPAPVRGAEFDRFVDAYSDAYDGEDVTQFTFTAQAYDAAWMVLYGAAWAEANEDDLDGLGIARGLRRVSEGTELSVGQTDWPVARNLFGDMESVDLVGASGSLNYDPNTEEVEGEIEVWTIRECGGTRELVIVPTGEAAEPCP